MRLSYAWWDRVEAEVANTTEFKDWYEREYGNNCESGSDQEVTFYGITTKKLGDVVFDCRDA
jgi:hypothetical protein